MVQVFLTCAQNFNESEGLFFRSRVFTGYHANGNMTKDGLNALNLQYNFLNLTSEVRDLSDNILAEYRWLADGTKVGVKDAAGTQGLEYIGSLIYKRVGGELQLESTDFGGGRIEVSEGNLGNIYTPNYYFIDHLGSTRAVWYMEDVTPRGGMQAVYDDEGNLLYYVAGDYFGPKVYAPNVLERSNFTPFGTRWNDAQASTSRYQFTGYEDQPWFDNKLMDAGARFMGKVLPIYETLDRKLEDYYSWTPYHYTLNNPIRYVDLFGLDVWEMDYQGRVKWIEEGDTHTMYALDKDGARTGQSITIKNRSIFDNLAEARDSEDYKGSYAITGSHEAGEVFLFAANNSNVEWSLEGYQGKNGRQYVLATSHEESSVNVRDNSKEGLTMENQYFHMHSHPAVDGTKGASGYGKTSYNGGDMSYIVGQYNKASKRNISLPTHYVYHKQSKTLYQYTPWVPNIYIKTIKDNKGLRFIVPKR